MQNPNGMANRTATELDNGREAEIIDGYVPEDNLDDEIVLSIPQTAASRSQSDDRDDQLR